MKPIVFGPDAPVTLVDYPQIERLVRGNPQRQTRATWQSPEGLSVGVWQCAVGAWKIQFASTKCEFFCVLSGRVALRDEQGQTWLVEPLQAAIIPAGFRGVFEVLEPVCKYYVVLESPAA